MKIKLGEIVLFVFLIVASLTAIVIIFDSNQPEYYFALLLMPMTFFVVSLIFSKVYNLFLKNLGVSIILALLFVRMVISPLLMSLGDYSVTITKNIEKNTFGAILLICYECVAIFFILYYCSKHKIKNSTTVIQIQYFPKNAKKRLKTYKNLLFLLSCALLMCYLITPELKLGYRTILQITDPTFTHYEDSYLISAYGTTFVKKFFLVTGTYLMRICTIIIPAYFVVVLSQRKGEISRFFSWIMCFVPLFFIGGTIATSLIYFVILLMVKVFCGDSEKSLFHIFLILFFAAAFIVVWWLLRLNVASENGNIFSSFSTRISAYFSGVNVVSGVFNLPKDLEYRFTYFCYDFLGSIPFGTTLFGLNKIRISAFFNLYNESGGQIPTTIGMGYYYLGPIFAPVYSIFFVFIIFKASEKLNESINPFRYMRYLLTIVFFSMGIVMYNIEITMMNFFTVILPIYIIERLAWRKNDKTLLSRRNNDT